MSAGNKTRIAWISAILAGLVLFIPFLGGVHLFDWDEINFAESAREMLATGDYLTVKINFLPFWEKPPLFIWMQVVSMKLFGINAFAARFPNAICGVFSLMALFYAGRKIFNETFGLLWMLVYAGSILPFFYFKSGIIDPWFNLFIFLGITRFSYYFIYEQKRLQNIILSAFFIGLAILTKGPVALLILILVFGVFLIYQRFRISTSFRDVAVFILVLAFTGGFWFILQIMNGNYQIIKDFIIYQVRLFSTHDAGHRGFLLYHFVVLFAGVFPASILALPVIFKKPGRYDEQNLFGLWMKMLFWTVLILFTIVQTKIVHYSSLCYFPLTFIATVFVHKLYRGDVKWPRWNKTIVLITAAVYAVAIMALPLIGMFSRKIIVSGLIKDPFAEANLMANVHWSGLEVLIGPVFLLLILFILYFLKNRQLAVTGIFAVTILFTYFNVVFITPKIEGYSQRAAIEFYKSLSDKKVYVATLGYKSYAQLFYADIKPYNKPEASETTWLLNGDIDRPAYFVYKIQRKERYREEYPQLEILFEKNGFVFTKRKEKFNR
ncbi:MAG TPA: glycosyltransferase family 39 protein [Bacteroidales bacterium]|nr:glycosyltransferase family 39 protein [Bacteroidales bacterium]